MSMQGRYTIDPERVRGYSLLEIDAYVYIVLTLTNICLIFFMDSIIAYSPENAQRPAPWETASKCSQRFVPFHSAISGQHEGQIFHEAQDLATDDKYIGLRKWHNQQHRAATSSGPRED